jgi:N-acetyl-gamma-glutamyl-phosphate reductase
MIKVGIIGGAGYTAGELLRILIYHPQAEVVFVQSSSNAGNPVSKVHDDLLGDTDLVFTDTLPLNDVDVIFLCMGHGKSKEFIEKYNLPSELKVIDLSHDFRLKRTWERFYIRIA